MQQPLKTQAIQTALTGDWENAISINKQLLKENPDDIETLNRLAYAMMAMGKIKQAKDIYLKVLKIDTKNPIALKNIKRLPEKRNGDRQNLVFDPQENFDTLFLEESGKTKIIELINVAEPKFICDLQSGKSLNLNIKRLKIFALDDKNHYIGMLPDNIAKRLIKLQKGGNIYEVYVKAVENRKVTIFVRETKRSTKFKNQPSFISMDKLPLKIYSEEE